jgi:glutamyl-Q tRNA(Asp) synthetase
VAQRPGYRGRFAPSPTGPLHFGSLLAALGSYLDARAAGGEWLLRVEDIDPPREVPGATDRICRSLEAHGLHWDGPVLYQSTRSEAYDEALAILGRQDRLFRCCCTRSTLGPGGSCGERCRPTPDAPCSTRVRLHGERDFEDLLLGHQAPLELPADLVLKRKDGLYAYTLAVVVDDGWQHITHVIRGRDLLTQTPAQCQLLEYLSFAPPAYGHLPVLTDAQGSKLSKQTGAAPIDDRHALNNLRLALRYLGQASADATAGSPEELLLQASALWDRGAVAAQSGPAVVYPPPHSP